MLNEKIALDNIKAAYAEGVLNHPAETSVPGDAAEGRGCGVEGYWHRTRLFAGAASFRGFGGYVSGRFNGLSCL